MQAVQLYTIPSLITFPIPGPIHGFRFVQGGDGAAWRIGENGPFIAGHGRGGYRFLRPGNTLHVTGSQSIDTVVEVLKGPELDFAMAIGADDLPLDADGAVLVGTNGGNPLAVDASLGGAVEVHDGGNNLRVVSPTQDEVIADLTGLATGWSQHGADITVPAGARSFHLRAVCSALSGGASPKLNLCLVGLPDGATAEKPGGSVVGNTATCAAGSHLALAQNPDAVYSMNGSGPLNFATYPVLPSGKLRLYYYWAPAPSSHTHKFHAKWCF